MKRPSASTLAMALMAIAADATPQFPGLSSSRGSGAASRTCRRILRQPVSGCTNADFATGSCSAACAAGLESMQSSLQDACDGAEDGPPFLRAALEGRLVEVACRQGVEDEDEDGGDSPTTTGERERDVPETNAPAPTPTPAPTEAEDGSEPSPESQPTGRPEERSGGDGGKPNGVGGSPFDIVAGGGAGLRVEAEWMVLGLGVLFLAR
ncbi:hypothetical protein VUR80DRAFT_1894 [Thermomyces stellatus]